MVKKPPGAATPGGVKSDPTVMTQIKPRPHCTMTGADMARRFTWQISKSVKERMGPAI